MSDPVVRELTIRYQPARAPAHHMTTSLDVVRCVQPKIGTDMVENFVVLSLNAKSRVISWNLVSRGSMTSCPVKMVDLFRPVIISGAGALIVAHNHPSGDCTPSPEDVSLTGTIKDAAELLGLKLLDHVIVTEDPTERFSFVDSGLLRKLGSG